MVRNDLSADAVCVHTKARQVPDECAQVLSRKNWRKRPFTLLAELRPFRSLRIDNLSAFPHVSFVAACVIVSKTDSLGKNKQEQKRKGTRNK